MLLRSYWPLWWRGVAIERAQCNSGSFDGDAAAPDDTRRTATVGRHSRPGRLACTIFSPSSTPLALAARRSAAGIDMPSAGGIGESLRGGRAGLAMQFRPFPLSTG